MTTLSSIRNAAIEDAGAGGLTVYATKEDLPTSGLTAGDQAYVSANSRLYVSNGSGWYNIALINATPSLSIDPTGTISLSTTGETTTITLTATDSDNAVAGLTYSVDSDGSFGGLATISQDSSVFTITPLSEDSATTTSAVLTFKASDGINFGSGDRTLTLSFKVENSNYTTLLLKNEETTDNQVDASGENHAINTGAKSTAFTPYHPGGYSTYFDGTDDFIEGPSVDLMGSGAFTVECWAYVLSNGSTYTDAFLAQYQTNNKFILGVKSNVVRVWMGGSEVRVGTTNINNNGWHHIALVRNASNSCQLYVDGVADGAAFSNSTDFSTSLENFEIGSWDNGSGSDLHGYISDLRVVKGTAVYTSTFTPPTERLTAITNTSLLACHLPYIADGSTNGHTITINGNTSTKRFGPYDYLGYTKADHGGSLKFNSSTNDYMTTDGAVANADFTLGTGDFTIEYWTYWTGTNVWITVDFRTSQSQAYPALYRDGNTGALTYYVSGANKIVGSGTTGTIYANVWNHIALVRNSGTTTLYKDGVSVGSFSDSTNYASGYWKWGRNENTWYFDGWASDMRLVKGTAVYTSNFTPPTAPLTAITNTKLLTATNKNDVWDASSGNLLTKAGDVTGGANSGTLKFGQTAIYFDGNGDYISAPTSDIFDLAGSVVWTIEGWFYWSSLSGEQTLVEKFTGGTGPGWTLYKLNTSNAIGFYSGSSATFSNAIGTVTSGQWYHVALTRDAAGTVRGFLDGTLNASGTYSIGNNSTGNLYIGSRNGSANYMNGYVQDVRITKGLARYTSSFTPPTAEFDG